jgi:Tfp pilus assembly protein PilF
MADLDEAVEAALATAGAARAELRRRSLAGDEDGWVALAEQRAQAGDGDGAVAVLSSLLEAHPASVEGWAAMARVFTAAGLAEDAAGCWQQAVAIGGRPEHLFALGSLLQGAGDAAAAAGCYVRAVRADPGLIAAHHNLAGLYAASGRLDAAVQHYEQVVATDPGHARAWGNLGVVLRQLGRDEEAAQALERAVAADPRYARAWANLASAREAANDVDGARSAVRRALALDARDPLARLTAARLDRAAGELERASTALDALATESLSGDVAARVRLESGFVRDRLGDVDGAFAAFEAGQGALARLPAAQAVDRRSYPQLLANIAAAADRLLDRPPPEDADPAPVFVVGFPRSGTTLTEQIVAAHPDFATSDEAPLLERCLARVAGEVGVAYPLGLVEADDDAIRSLRAAYRASLPAIPGRFVDKFPLNLVHLPAIRLLFPTAPVVLVLRDPRDAVLSAFMQDFVPNEAMIHTASLAGSAALYDRVMGLWRAWAPRLPAVHTLRYEDVVDDLEGEARRLLAALGAPWDPAVLDYHRRAAERRISTPSHRDVAQPIFRRSAGRWRRYEAHLAPVLPLLAPHAAAFGYAP